MSLTTERIDLNPLEEATTNAQLLLSGTRNGHGIYVASAKWDPADEDIQVAQSVDTEGAHPVATTVKTRPGPTVAVHVIEPPDAASVNYATNPQVGVDLTGYGGQSINRVRVRDLPGADYAILVNTVNAGDGVVNFGNNWRVPVTTAGQNMTLGVWLKGAAGGETLQLLVYEQPGNVSTVQNITLTSEWAFYTVTRAFSAGQSSANVQVKTSGSQTLAFYATGFTLVQGASLSDTFDGTWAGCAWAGAPHASVSTRPAPGGPRRDAIIADLERAVVMISRLHTGTLRRTTPGMRQVTFDLLGARLQWDETKYLTAGVASATLQFTSQPYARGPELTSFTDAFDGTNPLAQSYTSVVGAAADYVLNAGQLQIASNVTTTHTLAYTAGEYDWYAGEVQFQFTTDAAAVSNTFFGGALKVIDANNYLYAGIETDGGGVSRLRVFKVQDGATSSLLSQNLAANLTTNSTHTVRARLQLDLRNPGIGTVYAEHFTGAIPTATASPADTASPVLLSAADSAAFGPRVPGDAGIRIVPGGAGARVDNLTIAPYLVRERSLPAIDFAVAGIPGSAPGLGRLVVEDNATADQWSAIWGLQRALAGDVSATSKYYYEAEALTPLGGAAVAAGDANPSGSGNNVVKISGLTESYQAILSTQLSGGGAQLSHVGDFRVYARVYTTNTSLSSSDASQLTLCLDYAQGDLRNRTVNAEVPIPCVVYFTGGPLAYSYQLVDLGTVHLDRVTNGTQQWNGRILAKSTYDSAGNTDVVEIDGVYLIPTTDGGALASGVTLYENISAYTAYDIFTTEISGNLTGQSANAGGVWSAGGPSATDFTVDGANDFVTRSVQNDNLAFGRIAYLGAMAAQTSTVVQVDVGLTVGGLPALPASGQQVQTAVLARIVGAPGTNGQFIVGGIIWTSGTPTAFVAYSNGFSSLLPVMRYGISKPVAVGTTATIRMAVYADGQWALWINGAFVAAGQDALLATGGALASGQCGFYDLGSGGGTAIQRKYDNFFVGTPTQDAAIFSGRKLEVRSDRQLRDSSSGWAGVNDYEGSYLKLPTDQDVLRFGVKASRGRPLPPAGSPVLAADKLQLSGMVDAGIDPITAQLNVTPRWASVADV